MPRGVDKCHQPRDESPGDHDPRQPPLRAVALRKQRPGDLEQHVPGEKHPRPQPEHLRRKPQVLVHRQRRITQVNPVQIRDDRRGQQGQDDMEVRLAPRARRHRRTVHARLADWFRLGHIKRLKHPVVTR